VLRRSVHDREILRLAALALPALAAEPTYLLVDTAIVGHLGTPQLAALALAATVLTAAVALCNFLTYGTTAQVARLHGAGQDREAGALGAQALWLSLAVGLLVAALVAALAGPLVAALGGTGETARLAERYLRLSALGVPFALVALAGQGWLRGMDRLRLALWIVVAANGANVVLDVVLVLGLGLGLDGSAIGTVVAQAGMGAAFAWCLLRGSDPAGRRPDLVVLRRMGRMGGHLVVRTGTLLVSFTLASAVLARQGAAPLAAHQIAFQLFVFLALVLDAVAIAGQVLVGRALGAGDAAGAREAAGRMCVLSVAGGVLLGLVLLAGTSLVPRAFTGDEAVLEEARALWPLFALLQVPGALAFALDGILIGAGDSRYLAWAMTASTAGFVPLCLLADGVVGVWAALVVFMLLRDLTLGVRFRQGSWLVVGSGAPAAPE
jgi:putative MATE family efflux protein